jgi:hypothetical protein
MRPPIRGGPASSTIIRMIVARHDRPRERLRPAGVNTLRHGKREEIEDQAPVGVRRSDLYVLAAAHGDDPMIEERRPGALTYNANRVDALKRRYEVAKELRPSVDGAVAKLTQLTGDRHRVHDIRVRRRFIYREDAASRRWVRSQRATPRRTTSHWTDRLGQRDRAKGHADSAF